MLRREGHDCPSRRVTSSRSRRPWLASSHRRVERCATTHKPALPRTFPYVHVLTARVCLVLPLRKSGGIMHLLPTSVDGKLSLACNGAQPPTHIPLHLAPCAHSDCPCVPRAPVQTSEGVTRRTTWASFVARRGAESTISISKVVGTHGAHAHPTSPSPPTSPPLHPHTDTVQNCWEGGWGRRLRRWWLRRWRLGRRLGNVAGEGG